MTRTIQPEEAGALEQEVRTWLANKERLLQEAPGKLVVIKGDQIFGIFDRDNDAFTQAYRQFGRGPFLVRRIEPGKKVYYLGGSALESGEIEEAVARPETTIT